MTTTTATTTTGIQLYERKIIEATIDILVPQDHAGNLDQAMKEQASALFVSALLQNKYDLKGAEIEVDTFSFTFEAHITPEGVKCWKGLCSCKAHLLTC